jgi:5,10-methylenetetrahydromethanopterin reductase
MTDSRISFGVSRLARDPRDFSHWARLVDECGYDLLGFGDSQARWAECYSILTVAALVTKHVRIGPFVSNPVTRHPQVSAGAISTVDSLSGGRAFFGIGTGETATHDTGARRPTVRELEEYSVAVHGLVNDQRATWQGQDLQMLWPTPKVPVWVAGMGYKTLHMAGRVGDGVIVGNGATPENVRYALGAIESGAAETGRTLDDLEVWFMTRVHIASSTDAGYEELRFYLAAYADDRLYGKTSVLGQPIPADVQDRLAAMHEEFDDENRLNSEADHNAGLIDKYELRDWVGEQFAITGTPETCIAKLTALADAGERNIVVPQMLPDIMGTTREFAEKILPAFR